jgi:glycosyltransferase involved in cell wall biosynthesis
MRIAFDGTSLGSMRTRFGIYAEHLLHHLVQQGQEHEFTVVSNHRVETTVPLPERVKVRPSRWRAPRAIWMQALAPRTLGRLQFDLAHFTSGMIPLASPVPTVLTIHDFSLMESLCQQAPGEDPRARRLVKLAARRAVAVITASESARQEIVRCCDIAPARVHVVHGAPVPSFCVIRDLAELERVRRRYELGERFMLHVGTIAPGQNVTTLIEAFAKRRKTGEIRHQLVFAGPLGWRSRRIEALIERLQVEDSVRFTGRVPFEDLPALYNLAEMLVVPAPYKGFSLPVVEAMACGTPIVAGPVSALTEADGPMIEQVPSLDADSLGEALVTLAASRERRHARATLGLQRVRAFSWERTARETLEVYRQAQAGRLPASAPAPAAVRS